MHTVSIYCIEKCPLALCFYSSSAIINFLVHSGIVCTLRLISFSIHLRPRFSSIDWFLIDCYYCPHANVSPIKHTCFFIVVLFLEYVQCTCLYMSYELRLKIYRIQNKWKCELKLKKTRSNDKRNAHIIWLARLSAKSRFWRTIRFQYVYFELTNEWTYERPLPFMYFDWNKFRYFPSQIHHETLEQQTNAYPLHSPTQSTTILPSFSDNKIAFLLVSPHRAKKSI